MTTDREFDRIAMAWLADGPVELSDRVLDAVVDEIHLTRQRRASRVPWRFPPMTMPARVAAIVAIGALILAGVAVVGGVGRSGPAPSSAPASVGGRRAIAPSPRSSPIALPALDQTFTSPRHGYTVKVPTGWTVTPATKPWPQGSHAPQWGDPNADEIKGSSLGMRRSVAATHPTDRDATGPPMGRPRRTAWAPGDYCDCAPIPGSLPTTKVAGYTGIRRPRMAFPLRMGRSCRAARSFDDVAVAGDGAYVFTLDGNVDRAMLDAFLSTVSCPAVQRDRSRRR